jgi:hypothetical protein
MMTTTIIDAIHYAKSLSLCLRHLHDDDAIIKRRLTFNPG